MKRDSDSITWLLEGGAAEPLAALSGLLGAAPDAPQAQECRRAIMTEETVAQILVAQWPDGHWEGPDRFYTAKYRGTVWTLLILAELGADGADERVRAGCEAVLRDSQDPQSGGFSQHRSKRAGGGLPSEIIPCLTGNMVFSLIRFGMLDDPRVQRGLDWITTWQRFDDAEGDAPTGGPYDRYEMCWGRHTCHMGAVKALKALAEVPPERRTPAMHATISAGAEYLLRHHIFKRSHDRGPIPAGMCVRGVRGPSGAVTRRSPRSRATWGSGEGPHPRCVHGRIRACRPAGIGPKQGPQARLAPLRLPADVPDGRARDPLDPHEAGE